MIFRSRLPELPIPEDASIWKALEDHTQTIGSKKAFICGITEKSLTFSELLDQAKKVCAGLAANGIKKGDVVILHSFNCLEYVVVFLALNRVGAIVSPSSPLFNGKELADQIEIAEAVAVISHKKFAKVAVEAAGLRRLPLSRVFTLGQAEGPSGLKSIEGLIAQNLPFPTLPPIDTNQVVTLPFSSGTTGRPKGVELTARAMYACGILPAYREADMKYALGMLPFFHIMATMIFHVTIYKGVTLVVLPGFDPETFLSTVVKYKMTKLNLAPPLVTFLAKHPIVDKYDLSHVTHVGSGGAPLGKEVEHAVMQRLGIQVLQGYGMTEFAGCATSSYPTTYRDGASGTLHPNTELKVKDLETDKDLGVNQTGELLFRTPALMKGYYKNPEANRVTFTSDGFVRTGDVGYIDEDGYIFIVDRLKELIKYKGHQVAPAEVEDVVNSHPKVADSGCVRGFDPSTGEEIPKAFVVLKEGESLSEDELMEYVAGKVTGYKRVREVEFIDIIPKSLSGKILRRELQIRQNDKIKTMQSRLSHPVVVVQNEPGAIRSSFPDVFIPDDAALWNKLEQHAHEEGDKPAFVCGMSERTLTFAQAFELAKLICTGLVAKGIKKGDTVILHSFNCLEYPIVFLALNRLGAICSPSSPLFNSEELADQIQSSKASAVLSHVVFGRTAVEAAKLTNIPLDRVFTLGHPKGITELQTIEALVELNLPFPNLPKINPDDVVLLPFSSGTTGRPKGVELTARAMYACGARVASLEPDADYILSVLPFYHIAATMFFHVTIFKRMTLIILPRFEPGSFLRTIEKFKLDIVNVVPPIIQFLAKHPLVDKYDLSSLNRLGSGAAPLGDKLVEAVHNRLGLSVLQSYGMTEIAGTATHSSATEFRDGSSGKLLPNTELRVRCLKTGIDLPANRQGELLIRSPGVMKGYFDNPNATREILTDDGFICTGDVGYIDQDGYIFIVDRLKELIKYKGHQVAPAEIEDVINSHPQVADSCCVRGLDLASGDEIPKAFVVIKFDGDEPLTPEKLMTYVASKVAGFKRIREVEFINAIPKSAAGKILRRKLQILQDKKVESVSSRL